MTILFVSIEFNYCCGISQSIFSLSSELKKRGHNIILCAPGGTMVDDCIKGGIEFFYVPIRPRKKKIQDFWIGIRRIRKIIRERKVDVIHSHNRLADFFSFTANLLLNKPTVITAHALISGNKKLSFRADTVIAVSEAVKKMLTKEFKIDTARIQLIRNIPRHLRIPREEEIEVFKKNVRISENEVVIACIGRLHHEKGFDILLKAIKQCDNENVKVIIAGKGEERAAMSAYVEENGLNVLLIDEINRVELVYSIADIIVVPSRQESAGLVAIEAGFFKKPVIATCVGGLVETIENDVNGILVPTENPRQLSAAIERLLKNKDLGAQLGKQLCSDVNEEYGPSKIADKVESLYMQMTYADGVSKYS